MTYRVIKTSTGYTLIINREDGTQNDYRFSSKRELDSWLKATKA